MKNATNSMLVTVNAANSDEYCFSFKTYEPRVGSRGSFLVDSQHFAEWLTYESTSYPFMAEDCGNIVKITSVGKGKFLWQVWWLSGARDSIRGVSQIFYLSDREMREILLPGHVVRKVEQLYENDRPTARILFTDSAMRNIRSLKAPEKTALKKFLRTAFRWYNPGIITVCADGGKDFFFRESGGICGGIVLHKLHHIGGDGLNYSLHT